MGGFFKVYRDIFQHEIFKHELDFRLFMLILGNAMYDKNGATIEGIHVKRGQWIRSYRNLMKDLEFKQGRGYKQHGIGTIKRAVERLVKNELVTVSETECGTLFTVVNYEKYQGISQMEKAKVEQLAEHNEQNIDLGIDKRNGIRNGMRNTINSPEAPEIPSDFTNGRCDSGTVSGTVSGTLAEQKKESKKDKKINDDDDIFAPLEFEEIPIEDERITKIKKHFSKRSERIFYTNDEDKAISDLLEQGVPVETIIAGIDLAFKRFRPKHSRDRINSFKYCLSAIHELHEKGTTGLSQTYPNMRSEENAQRKRPNGRNQTSYSSYPEIGGGYYDQFPGLFFGE